MTRHEKLIQSLLSTPAFVDPINAYCVNEFARIEKECKNKFNIWLADVVLQEVVTVRKDYEDMTRKELNKTRENMRELVKREVTSELDNFVMVTRREIGEMHKEIHKLRESVRLVNRELMRVQCFSPWQRFKRWITGE